jgi:hypothetical protein
MRCYLSSEAIVVVQNVARFPIFLAQLEAPVHDRSPVGACKRRQVGSRSVASSNCALFKDEPS